MEQGKCECVCLIRQEVSALRADFVRRQAEEEAYHVQQVMCWFKHKIVF